MGSRRRRYAALTLALVAACSSGPPKGFVGGAGDRWSFPLVGPLEDGALITPVLIDGRGPFLFAIDPDANVSILDEQLVKELKLPTGKGPRRVDESATEQPRFYAEVRAVELGTLIIEQITAMIVKPGTLDTTGRRILGVLGRDVLADALVFGFDRDHGLAHLLTVKAFTPPAAGVALPYTRVAARLQNAQLPPIDRRVVTATFGGQEVRLHLDLGAAVSQLRESMWAALGLVPVDGKATLVDEVGTSRTVTKVAVATQLAVGTAVAASVVFAPYADQRFLEDQLDGTLGLDFFRGFTTWLAWDAKRVYVAPRAPVDVAQRIARWEVGALGKCKNVGCVAFRLVDPLAGKEVDPTRPHPGVVLAVTRDEAAGGMDLEVVLEASKPGLPRIVVNLPPNSDRVMQHLKADWVGVTLRVVDASPFPRSCPNNDGCVDLLAR